MNPHPMKQFVYDKYFAYGGLWFQWWKNDGEKRWEKYLMAYYKKFKRVAD